MICPKCGGKNSMVNGTAYAYTETCSSCGYAQNYISSELKHRMERDKQFVQNLGERIFKPSPKKRGRPRKEVTNA